MATDHENQRDIKALAEQGHRHGKKIDVHQYRLDDHERTLEAIWKNKVSVDRYIWVERFVVGACGAILLWAFQHLTAAQTIIDAARK